MCLSQRGTVANASPVFQLHAVFFTGGAYGRTWHGTALCLSPEVEGMLRKQLIDAIGKEASR